MCMILFYLPNFNGGWLVGWLGSVVKVVESAVIWLLTGFGVRGLREKKKTLNQHQWQCVTFTYVVLSV